MGLVVEKTKDEDVECVGLWVKPQHHCLQKETLLPFSKHVETTNSNSLSSLLGPRVPSFAPSCDSYGERHPSSSTLSMVTPPLSSRSEMHDSKDLPLRGGRNHDSNPSHLHADLGFRVENLNLSIPAPCGCEKCFFREKGERHRVGYLLIQKDPEKDLTIGRKGWDLARKVERDFGVPILFGPVQAVNLSHEDATKMNEVLLYESTQKRITNGYYRKGTATFYTVKIAPQPSLLLGISSNKKWHVLDHLHELISASSDKVSFLDNFRRDAKTAMTLVEKVNCLADDFQAILDTSGRLWHHDFDRCFRWSETERKVVQRDFHSSADRVVTKIMKSRLKLYVKTAKQIVEKTTMTI